MGCLGNIIWMLCGGLVSALGYLIAGCIWCITIVGIPIALHSLLWGCIMCITIIGIPFGLQHFKMAKLALMPFGTVVY